MIAKLKHKVKSLRSSRFVMQILTLMSGAIISQLLMLIFVPVITRMYSPSEFGAYSLFLSISNIIGLISSLKYDQAIMLPRSNRSALALVYLSCGITLITTLIVFSAILLFRSEASNYFTGFDEIIWLLPFGILLTGLNQVFNAFSSRHQFYRKLSSNRITNSILVIGSQIGGKAIVNNHQKLAVWIKLEFLGKVSTLAIGKLLADAMTLLSLIYYHFKKKTLTQYSVKLKHILLNLRKYDNFPKYQSLTVFFNSTSQSLPILILSWLYSPEIAGFYGLTIRVLQAPITLIAASTREVYYQKASRLFANGDDIYSLYKKSTLGLLKIFTVPLIVILIWGPEIFRLVFGEKWAISGEMSQILIFWFACGFINYPSLTTYSILGLQKIQMRLETASLVMRAAALLAGYYIFESYYYSIAFFMLSSSSTNLFTIFYITSKLKKSATELTNENSNTPKSR